ncbi:MAG: type VII toxin-antitoxin system HepT family RNase toxin [Peptococcia bacterium]|jgi:uncharacterized protein YutE (UPF0331/DUF86 family)
MDERIMEHLKLLQKYLDYLTGFSHRTREEFLHDIVLRGATERYLQLVIESTLNIGNRIIATEAARSSINAPENYADVFVKLGELGIISQEFALELVKMARFRNRLVHAYWEVDAGILYEILQDDLQDLVKFKNEVIAYLSEK